MCQDDEDEILDEEGPHLERLLEKNMEKSFALPEPEYPALASERSACDMGKKGYLDGTSLEDGMQSLLNLVELSYRPDTQSLIDAYEAGWLFEENHDTQDEKP